ncbi:MAG TPA: serine/threonine-protein kinase, partial [Gemmataceae bacterium]|nr:serine/threonine-protein kinase [Gemmataceae bacterium]
AQLQHPGIIPVYELSPGSAERPAFYTMKFIRGRTLADACKQYHQRRAAGKAGPLELRELLSAFVTVCQAVGYAHSRAVIHRDLKPANVALGDYGEVLVLDFGLSKLMGETPEPPGPNGQPASLLPVSLPASEARGQTIHGQALGTPSYMAPEQAEGRIEQIDARSDIYGLGAILYEVLTGQAPFTGPDTGAILAQVVCDPPVPPRRRVPAIPRALEAICLKALAKQRTQRYASASELAAEVQRFLADEPVQAFPEPWTMKTRRWLGRHRTAVATATATLLVATVGLAIGAVLLAAAGERARAAKLNAERQQNRAKRLAYMTGILAVERARDEGNLARARSLIQELPTEADTQDLRDFEWHYLRRLCDEAPLWAADLHPSAVETETGQEVLSLQGDGAGIIALSGPSLAFSPDGRCLAMSTGTGPIELWETARPTSVGEQRAANALVANLFGTIPRRTAVLQQLRAMPLLDTSIRQQALAAAQAYPEDAEHLDILAWNIVQAPDRPAS